MMHFSNRNKFTKPTVSKKSKHTHKYSNKNQIIYNLYPKYLFQKNPVNIFFCVQKCHKKTVDILYDQKFLSKALLSFGETLARIVWYFYFVDLYSIETTFIRYLIAEFTLSFMNQKISGIYF